MNGVQKICFVWNRDQVEEGVEEDGGHAAAPQVGQADLRSLFRPDHVQHLNWINENLFFY